MNIHDANNLLLKSREILDSLDIPFFLTYGTCLGIYRDKTLLPYDKDIDVGVLAENLMPKIDDLALAFGMIGYRAIIKNAEFHQGVSLSAFAPCGLHIDIAGFIKAGNDRYTPSTRHDFCLVYPAEMLEQRESVFYLDWHWYVPYPVEGYLAYQYGDSWITPDMEWKEKKSRARVVGYYHKINGGSK